MADSFKKKLKHNVNYNRFYLGYLLNAVISKIITWINKLLLVTQLVYYVLGKSPLSDVIN